MKIASLLTAIALFLIVLTGCDFQTDAQKREHREENKIVGTFKNVKVVDKKKVNRYKATNDYSITVQKDDQKVKLQTKGEESFDAIQKGNIVTVGYNRDFEIQKITFEKMEESK